MNREDNCIFELCKTYERYGYRNYKVSDFEEYDLYAKNKNFLISSRILTFNDINGKLMALKPDVTLSIIKNTKDDDRTKKVYYTESVYRVPHNGGGFKEIMQTGLECIGDIDTYTLGEVIMLAAKSLSIISEKYILDISNIGIISSILADLEDEVKARLIDKISEKNPHGIRKICTDEGVDEGIMKLLLKLIAVYEPLDEAIKMLEEIDLPLEGREAVGELKTVARILDIYDIKEHIYVDFSIVNDMTYYNGILFKGFVDGIAEGVLSGGQYDNLLSRLGKNNGAIGFAVYLDQIENLYASGDEYDADVVINYDDSSDVETLIRLSEKYIEEGMSVRVQKGEGCIGRKNIAIRGTEVIEIGSDD